MQSSVHIRRWQRQAVDLPLRVVIRNGPPGTVVPGRGTEISPGGMALYAAISLDPGDLMEIEFQAPFQARVCGVIRSRTGYYFGLEFLTPLLTDNEKTRRARLAAFALEQGRLAETELRAPAAVNVPGHIKAAEKAAAAYAMLAKVFRSEGESAKAEVADQARALFLGMKGLQKRRK